MSYNCPHGNYHLNCPLMDYDSGPLVAAIAIASSCVDRLVVVAADTFGPLMENLNVSIFVVEHVMVIQDSHQPFHFLLCLLTSIIIDLMVMVPLSSF